MTGLVFFIYLQMMVTVRRASSSISNTNTNTSCYGTTTFTISIPQQTLLERGEASIKQINSTPESQPFFAYLYNYKQHYHEVNRIRPHRCPTSYLGICILSAVVVVVIQFSKAEDSNKSRNGQA